MQYMQRAIQLAGTAQSNNEVPVGAVVVLNDTIIGEGYNQPIDSHDPTAHAEIIALRQAAKHLNNYRLAGAALYVTLEPCMMCISAMIHARIGEVIFGAYDLKAGAVTSVFKHISDPRILHFIKWQGGVLKEECEKLLVDFFKSKR